MKSFAFFSFKVLPELEDPGYYSDKAVASRSFVHENIYFSMMVVFGSIYYNDKFRGNLKAHWAGHDVAVVFVQIWASIYNDTTVQFWRVITVAFDGQQHDE